MTPKLTRPDSAAGSGAFCSTRYFTTDTRAWSALWERRKGSEDEQKQFGCSEFCNSEHVLSTKKTSIQESSVGEKSAVVFSKVDLQQSRPQP